MVNQHKTVTARKVSVFGVFLVRIFLHSYSVRMRENANQNNSEYGHFLRNVVAFMENFQKIRKYITK